MIKRISNPSIIAVAASGRDVKKVSLRTRKGRYFFVTMSLLFLIIAMVGFIPGYQDMYAGQFPIHWFAHVHGALMTSWLMVFITQTSLAAAGRLKFHRQLGLLSVVLGILIWISMWIVSARALIGYNPPVDSFCLTFY